MRVLIAAALSLIASFAFAETPRDADLAKLIVGSWEATVDYPQVKGVGVTRYKADGTFVSSGELRVQGRPMRIGAEGVWGVKGTTLTWTVKKTLNPEVMAVGETHSEEILEIDEKRIAYRDDEGETTVETRVADKR